MKILDKETNNTTVDEAVKSDRKNIDQLISYKKNWEPRWYLSMAFYEGVHFTYPKKDSAGNWQRKNTVGKYKVIREIPKAKKQLKSIRNLILKLKQKPIVYPDTNVIESTSDKKTIKKEEDKALAQARYIEYLLGEKMKLNKFKKKLIKHAELYSCSFIQILNENGEKEFAVYTPFEISIYPTISNVNEYPMLAKHISHRFEDLKGNKLYDQDAITRVEKNHKKGEYSKSIYMDSYMRERYGKAPDDTVIVDEIYKIVKVKVNSEDEVVEDEKLYLKENPEAEIQTVERVQITAYIGKEKVRDEVTKLTKIPISIFIWEDEAYETSLMEDLMPLNKAYDIFISKLEHKAKKMDTGRYAIQKREDTKLLTTNDGEFIRYKRFKPEVMPEAGVPNAFMETINLIEEDLKEQGVALTNASSLPQGVEAWRAIESIKDIDYSSIGSQQDNLNECLTDLTEKLVEMVAYDMVETETVIMKDENGKKQPYKVVGKRGADIMSENSDVDEDLIVIDPNRTVKVEIESDITWSEDGKRGLTLDLVKAGILPKEMALETLKFGNQRDIVQKLIEEETYGKSIIDSQEFKLLPVELQQAILKYLAQGAGTPPIPGAEQ